MKLTNDDRNSFVASVMADVPQVDYSAKAHELVMKITVSKLPPKVREIWKDATLRGFVKCDTYYHMAGSIQSIYHPLPGWRPDAETAKTLDSFVQANRAQRDAREDLKAKVKGIIFSCTTLKQAKDRLPEFEKYLPQDRDGSATANLPAISNVVAELVKAGWPKKQSKKSAAA